MIRVGVFFGGSSREREVSFAGGRCVYDNLDRTLFEPVPIFVDPWGRCIRLAWQHIYKGSIRDFYPPTDYKGKDFYKESPLNPKLLAPIGQYLALEALKTHIDVAFLVLHGPGGEDGSIQGMLSGQGIPYVGSGVYASALCMDKLQQRKLMAAAGFSLAKYMTITRKDWLKPHIQKKILKQLQSTFAKQRCVIKPANEGSSIGVNIVPASDEKGLMKAIYSAFFIERLSASAWKKSPAATQKQHIDHICDLRKGTGLPLWLEGQLIRSPAALQRGLNKAVAAATARKAPYIYLEGAYQEHSVLVEAFIEGREFSCILLEDDKGCPIALPPTEIRSQPGFYDYKAKYLPGMSRKLTPMPLQAREWKALQKTCILLYRFLGCEVYARMDGFLTPKGDILLTDPNTSSGMLPSSFLFHQAAEVGLSPSTLLSHLLRRSLQVRAEKEKRPAAYVQALAQLEKKIESSARTTHKKQKVAVITGGASAERHIAVESARNVYEKLGSSTKYVPLPFYLAGATATSPLYKLPLSLLLKDNADDIAEKLRRPPRTPTWLQKIRAQVAPLCSYYGAALAPHAQKSTYQALAQEVDMVFLALHGRPGEDGSVQQQLEALKIPYNGSSSASAAVMIDKYRTAEQLSSAGLRTPLQFLVKKEALLANPTALFRKAEAALGYPMVAKPVDEGCSAAVCKLYTRKALQAYATAILNKGLGASARQILGLSAEEIFPQKDSFLLERCIRAEGADRFLEISVGLLSKHQNEKLYYEIFFPSETLVQGEVLSLEEKFLAGEGQNITPARLSHDKRLQKNLSLQIKKTIKEAAQALSVTGYARVDAFVHIRKRRAEVLIIEVNALPGLTAATCFFHQAALAGYTPYELLDNILEESAQRYLQKQP